MDGRPSPQEGVRGSAEQSARARPGVRPERLVTPSAVYGRRMVEPATSSASATPHAAARPRVYLDRDALTVPRPTDDRHARPIRRRLVTGAEDALRHLADAKCEIVLLGMEPTDSLARLGVPLGFSEIVEASETETWVVTADPAWCERDRPAGVRSILVGPRRPPGPRPTAHCDIEARDLGAAVIEILTHEAMTDQP